MKREERKVHHLLNRLAYGARPGEAEALVALGEKGVDAWLEAQLNPESIADTAAEKKLLSLPTLKMDSATLWKKYQHTPALLTRDRKPAEGVDPTSREVAQEYYGENVQRVLEELQAKQLILAVEGKRRLNEVLFEFWWNHFNVDWGKIPVRWVITSYERDVIRPRLFGKFRDLLLATARAPAMLEYLDNVANNGGERSRAINENYARELMELHTLGSVGGYTQKDVIELARIMSGWAHGGLTFVPEYRFHAEWHDGRKKSFLGTEFPAGHGEDEGVRAVELLASHPSTARFLATKLVRFFVSDSPPPALVDRVAAKFRQTDGDLRACYKEVFTSPEFWAATPKIKRPYEFVVSAIRALDGEINPELAGLLPLRHILHDLGEPPFQCPSPTGYPDDPRVWMNPGGMVLRMKASGLLGSGSLSGVRVPRVDEGKARERVLALAAPSFQKR